jgi:predicted nucleotidyltransferase
MFAQSRARQRLIYNNSIAVDIVPFGAISCADGNIRWPPNQDEVMNIVGFEDAFKLAGRFPKFTLHQAVAT